MIYRSDMWQITFAELNRDKIEPIRFYNQSGTHYYQCGICGEPVGIHSGRCKHVPTGWLYRKDYCKNGHVVDWEGIE